MPQLYKHNKGKWLLPSVVSKNTASNEEKWWSLRRSPVMCHWPTLSLKINHKRGALWLRHGHPWSINPPPSPPFPHPAAPCLAVFLTFSLKTQHLAQAKSAYRGKMNWWNVKSYFYWLFQFCLQRVLYLRSWLTHIKTTLFAFFFILFWFSL